MSYFPVVFYTLILGIALKFLPHPVIVVGAALAPIVIIQVFKYPYIICLLFITNTALFFLIVV